MREIIIHREKTGLKEFTEKYIDVGDSVVICNLTGNLDLNGQRGTIIDYRAASINQILNNDRFIVELFKTKNKCSVKRQNLELLRKVSVDKKKNLQRIF